MAWSLDWGAKADAICDAARRAGQEPAALPFMQSRVDVRPDLLFTWRAFHDLSGDRQSAGMVGRIPFTAVDRYADRFGIDGRDEFERFLFLIRAMDAAFVEWAGKQAGKG